MIEPNKTYHFFNQGNNRERIFYKKENYPYFLQKVVIGLRPYGDILAYCLMPNHFHFLLFLNQEATIVEKVGALEIPKVSLAIKNIQSGYARAINKQQNRSGSLFRQRAKLKPVEDGDGNYPLTAFHYIHQNPVKAGLVKKMEDWSHSSFNEYWKGAEGVCNQSLAREIIDFGNDDFYEQSYSVSVQ